MFGGREPSRAMAIRLVLALVATLGACESRTPADAPPGGDGESSVVADDDSASDEPSSDVELRTFPIDSRNELLDLVGDVGWARMLVLPGADAIRLELWSGEGHWHATTTYRYSGLRVSVTQAGFEGLPPGQLVRVRGDYGVRSEGGLYWLERGFTIALRPGEKSLAAKLEWIALT